MNKLILTLLISAGFAVSTFAQGKTKKDTKNFAYTQHFPSKTQIEDAKPGIEKFYLTLQGHFTNKEQADTATIPQYREQEVIAVPIWTHRKGEYWLYQVRIPGGKPNYVVEETIIKLTPGKGDTINMEYFQLNTEHKSTYALEFLKEEPFKKLKPEQLIPGGCHGFAYAVSENDYIFDASSPCDYQLSGLISGVRRKGLINLDNRYWRTAYYDNNQQLLFEYEGEEGLSMIRLPHDKAIYNEKMFSAQ